MLLKNESNFFVIEPTKYKNLSKIFIELITYGSNIKLNILEENVNVKILSYLLLNKKIYTLEGDYLNAQKIKFEVNSNIKAYYSVRYCILRNKNINKLFLLDTIGINFIDYINNDYKYKFIEVQNSKYNKVFPILINFYSPNCEFDIIKYDFYYDYDYGRENYDQYQLNTYLYDNFYQEIIDTTKAITYKYNISIKKPSDFLDDMCILYSNSYKITNENSKKIGSLLINDNIPLVHKFEKNFIIRYIYPNYDYNKDTLINFKLINNRKYIIDIKDNSNNHILKKYITKSETINIEKNKYNPQKDECNLILDISIDDPIEEASLLITTAHQIKNKFYYLEKGMIKNEKIEKNGSLYLYTNIGKEDEGFIYIDFLKEKKVIKVKIIEINDIDLNNEINWESFNSTKEITNYDYYAKKIFSPGKIQLYAKMVVIYL